MTATGTTLSVYLSDPPAVSASQTLQDVYDAEQLAWSENVASVKNVSLHLSTGTQEISANARAAIANDNLIAYVGEIQTGQSLQTVGITNAEDVLELSPTDPTVPDKNDFESYASYGRTFASLPVDLKTSPAALQAADPGFVKLFRQQYGHAPAADAIEGYDAIEVLLRVIAALGGQANDRTKIVDSVIKTLQANQGQASVPAFTITLK